jgi:tRNA (cytosine49-C5)-methyltransferase
MDFEIPAEFRSRYESLSDQPEEFFAALLRPLPRSCRVNTLKANVEHVRERFAGYGIPFRPCEWYEHAFSSDDIRIGATLEHFIGAIYIQDLTSMLPPLLIREELKTTTTVLDACAAPGSKTTQLAALMANHGTVVANDLEYERIRALKFNLEKTGALNAVVTNYDLRVFPDCEFDIVLLDAPCTSEGTMRKDRKLFTWWSEKRIPASSHRQKQLILKSFDLLKPGGIMVYSTCTFAPEENEGVINHLLDNRQADLLPIEIANLKMMPGLTSWQGREFDKRLSQTRRILPHFHDTGGFFLAKVQK